MRKLLTALLTGVEDVLTCQACLSDLAAFLDAQLLKNESNAQFDDLKTHLSVCPACAQAYNELFTIAEQAYTKFVPNTAQQTKFDFTFLQTEPKQNHWWNELGYLVINLSEALVNAMREPTKPAYAGARSRTTENQLLQLNTEETGEEVRVDIRVRETDNPAYCTLLIEVDIPNRGGWPNLGGIAVALKQLTHEIDTQVTDPFGQASFNGIATEALADLSFEIAPGAE